MATTEADNSSTASKLDERRIGIENLLTPARDLAKGDDDVWQNHHFSWQESGTWAPILTAWLAARWRVNGLETLRPGNFRNYFNDDDKWTNLIARCLKGDLDV